MDFETRGYQVSTASGHKTNLNFESRLGNDYNYLPCFQLDNVHNQRHRKMSCFGYHENLKVEKNLMSHKEALGQP